jgi:hypothetical protein
VSQIAQRTVVLTGESVSDRASLIDKLQKVLCSQSLSFDFLCPQSPLALLDMPSQAKHLLWKNPTKAASHSDLDDWRRQLHELQRPYQTLHADSVQVLQQAVFALLNGKDSSLARPQSARQWQDLCECCADPACEQQLFSRLLQS